METKFIYFSLSILHRRTTTYYSDNWFTKLVEKDFLLRNRNSPECCTNLLQKSRKVKLQHFCTTKLYAADLLYRTKTFILFRKRTISDFPLMICSLVKLIGVTSCIYFYDTLRKYKRKKKEDLNFFELQRV